MQTLSAGIGQWEGKLPEGVRLSSARGAHGGSTAEWAITALLVTFRDSPDHPLWDAPGVLITPYVGGNTTGAMDRAWRMAARQVTAYVAGQDPPNPGPA